MTSKISAQVYQEVKEYVKSLDDRIKLLRDTPMGVKCDHIMLYVGKRILVYPDSEKMFEVLCLLTKEKIEFENCSFACVEDDGTFQCALQAVVKRLLKLAFTVNETTLHLIVKDVLFSCRQFPDFFRAFFAELHCRYPITIPFVSSDVEPPKHGANITRCGTLMGLMISYCIDANDTVIYPYSRDQALDGALHFLKKFISFIRSNPPESSLPYTFLLAYMRVLQSKLLICPRIAEVVEILAVLKASAEGHKFKYCAAEPTRRFIENFISLNRPQVRV